MTNERQDDEIIGRALSRAIETIDVNQTPYERSRIAAAPARRSIFGWSQLGFAVVGIILAVALGSWLTRPTESQPGVAASPTTPPASPSAAGPSPTANPIVATSVPTWVYFPRDGLPPVGASVPGYPPNSSSREIAIDTRISALRRLGPGEIPAGTTNPLSSVAPAQAGTSRFGVSVRIEGDLATVEFDLSSGWGVRGSAQSQALLQQLVYTITEEPGIRRALITEKGKPNAVIDKLLVDKPLTREDVSGYTSRGSLDPLQIGGVSTAAQLSTNYSVDSLAPGLARFVITLDYGTSGGSVTDPEFSATLIPSTNETTGKAELEITVPNGSDTATTATQVDRSPLRWIAAGKSNSFRAQVYRLGLDDQRPWRAIVLSNPTRIVIDIGGVPQATSDSVAVYSPKVGTTTGRTVNVSGAARAFEAHVNWRIKDSAGREVGNGFMSASIFGPTWGTFDTSVTIPANVSGNVTLEVFWPSPKDGTELGLVQIPLVVR
ncbi:MAG: hypothetical protein E6I49_14495 [Chloroflexi bacterium]|nr:MAG: hypothetical protein E6I49_14495 [Chloroflexota bacterium]